MVTELWECMWVCISICVCVFMRMYVCEQTCECPECCHAMCVWGSSRWLYGLCSVPCTDEAAAAQGQRPQGYWNGVFHKEHVTVRERRGDSVRVSQSQGEEEHNVAEVKALQSPSCEQKMLIYIWRKITFRGSLQSPVSFKNWQSW